MSNQASCWQKFKKYYFCDRVSEVSLDISRMNFSDAFLANLEPRLQEAYDAMESLEAGAIANPDENRMVGHYWLRDAKRAPKPEIAQEIEKTLSAMKNFARDVHSGKISPPAGGKFKHVLVIGIGGSALGPQFVNNALARVTDPMNAYFFDNTDPDGMDRVLQAIPELSKTLVVVISKSGGTKETRNGQLVAKSAFEQNRIPFAKHFVAVTGDGSELDKTATKEGWLARFPMWDWVGGRTSELSAVGLLPAVLQGFDIEGMLAGARTMDALTRVRDTAKNPAALMAAMWYYAGDGRGTKDMVVLPYKDRIELFSRYLQQLVMESLGKDKDLKGKTVNQGIAVYGNKGSTDQHAYVQQLRDGLNNFFVIFVEVLKDGVSYSGKSFGAERLEVETEVTSGDYLSGFYLGTRRALHESNRESVSITIPEVNPQTIGMLIALFERTVGYYATLVGINAYHQPGVEAGKKAAADVLGLQKKVVHFLRSQPGPVTIDQITAGLNDADSAESVFKILRHLVANQRVKLQAAAAGTAASAGIFEDKYSV